MMNPIKKMAFLFIYFVLLFICSGSASLTLLSEENNEIIRYTCLTYNKDYLEFVTEHEKCTENPPLHENYDINIATGEKSVDFLGDELALQKQFKKLLKQNWNKSMNNISEFFDTAIRSNTSIISLKHNYENTILEVFNNKGLKISLELIKNSTQCSSQCCWFIDQSAVWNHIKILIRNSQITLINDNDKNCTADIIGDTFMLSNDNKNLEDRWRFTIPEGLLSITNNFTQKIHFHGCLNVFIWAEHCNVTVNLKNDFFIYNKKDKKFDDFDLYEYEYCNSTDQNLLLEINHTNSGAIYISKTIRIKPFPDLTVLTCESKRYQDMRCQTIFEKYTLTLNYSLQAQPYNYECGNITNYCKTSCNITCGNNLYNWRSIEEPNNSCNSDTGHVFSFGLVLGLVIGAVVVMVIILVYKSRMYQKYHHPGIKSNSSSSSYTE